MKKIISVFLVLVMVLGLLAGCGQTEQKNSAETAKTETAKTETAKTEAAEPVTITVLTRYYDGAPEALRQFFYDRMIKFDEEHEDIIIEDISVGELDAFNSKLKASIAANDPPDVFQNYGYNNIVDWVTNGLVRDVSDLLEEDDYTGPTNPAYLGPWDYSAKGIEGIYGVPSTVNVGDVLYVNKKLLEEYGLSVPETWEDVYAMAPKLIENDIIPIALSAGTKGRLAHFHTGLSMRMFGLDLRDDLISGKTTWSDENSMAVLNEYNKMIEAGIFGPDPISMDASGMMAAFANGEAAMYVGMLGNAADSLSIAETEGDVIMANLPYFKDKPEYKDYWFVPAGDGLSIMTPENETARLEAAKKFVHYMTSQECYDEMAVALGVNVYPVEVDYDKLGVETSKPLADFLSDYNNIQGGSDEFDVYYDFASAQEIFRTEIQTMFAGVSPADVAASIDQQYAAMKK